MKLKLRPYPEYRDVTLRWLDRVPTHWEVQRAKTILHPVDVRSKTGQEELLTVSSHDGVRRRSEKSVTMFQAASYVGHKLCWPGDLVINSLWAWAKGLGVSPYHGIISTAYGVYRPNRRYASYTDYFHSLLRSEAYDWEFRVRSKGIWISRLQLTDTSFLDMPIVLPPPEEAEHIGRFIRAYDNRVNRLIRAKQRLIKLLNEQKQAIIQRAVTRGLDPHVRLKPSGVEWLGEVPEHWEVAPLKIFADIRISGVDKHLVPGEIEIRLCNYTDVYHQDFIDSSHEFMWATATPKEIDAFELRRGDVIITKDSETWDDIAVPAVVTEDLHGVVCGYHLALIRPSEQVEGEFLLRALQAPIIASQFHVAATGVTRYGLSKHSIKSAVIPLPPLSEQQAIIESVRQQVFASDETADRARREIKFLREYRTRLIADVVTGKLDVRGVEVPDAEGLEELVEADVPAEEDELAMQEAV